jgi:glycosyltransferase involved in cell wall biosynthesis
VRIGFDVSQTGPSKAGCGFYAAGLVRALATLDTDDQYIVYPSFGDHFYDPQIRCDDLARFRNVRVAPHQSHSEAKKFWARERATFESELGEPDIIHSNNFYAPRVLTHARLVFTLYDLSFLENWSWTTEANRTGCFEGVFRASLSADWLVAISQYTKERFLHTFPHYPEGRISVVYPASRFGHGHSEKKPPSKKLERRKFWLCVGTLEPRKNYPAILAAYAQLRKKVGMTHPLVIVGGAGWMMNSIEAEIQKLNLGGSVTLLGYAADAVLYWLYRNAACLVYPSLYEGFGMPVLEAMSCATPAIAATGSAFQEIVPQGDYPQLLVDPLNASSISNAMQLVHAMTPAQLDGLGEIAKKRAEEFSWSRSARSMLEVYRRVASSPKLFG